MTAEDRHLRQRMAPGETAGASHEGHVRGDEGSLRASIESLRSLTRSLTAIPAEIRDAPIRAETPARQPAELPRGVPRRRRAMYAGAWLIAAAAVSGALGAALFVLTRVPG